MFELEALKILLFEKDFWKDFLRHSQAPILTLLILSANYPVPAFGANSDEPQFLKDVHKTMVEDNWAECAALGELYLRKHKADPMGNAVKGYALLQQNQDKDALPYLNAAIKGGTTSLPTAAAESHANNLWSLRGYSLMRSGKLQEGIADLEKSLELKPRTCLDILNQRIDCLNIGAAYKKLGQTQKSVSYISAGDLMKRQYHHVFYPPLKSAAEAKFNAGKLENELRSDPKSTILMCKLAAMQMYMKNWSEALKYLDKTIAVEPYLMPARLLRCQALKRLKRSAEAKKDLAAIQKSRDKEGVNVWAVDKKELDEVMRL